MLRVSGRRLAATVLVLTVVAIPVALAAAEDETENALSAAPPEEQFRVGSIPCEDLLAGEHSEEVENVKTCLTVEAVDPKAVIADPDSYAPYSDDEVPAVERALCEAYPPELREAIAGRCSDYGGDPRG